MKRARAAFGMCVAILLAVYVLAPRAPRDACALVSIASGGDSLPKIVHQQWPTANVSDTAAPYHAGFRALFPAPEFEHILWTDESMRAFVAQRYEWFLPTYDAYDAHILRVDAFRYIALHAFGGLYADMDYEPLVNFWFALPSDRPAVVESVYIVNEEYQNSLMSSPRGHPFWIDVLCELVRRARRRGPAHRVTRVLWLTGPRVLSDVALERPGEVSVLACENFQRRAPGAGLRLWLGVAFRHIRWCGAEGVAPCEFARHHGFGSWVH